MIKLTRLGALVLFSCTLPATVWATEVINPSKNLQVEIPGMGIFQEANVKDKDMSSSWIAEYIVGLYKYGIGIIGIIAMLAIAIGAAMWVISAGNPGRIGEAKSWISNGLIGLSLGLGSYILLAMINSDLVNFKMIEMKLPRYEPTSGGGFDGINPSELPKYAQNYDAAKTWPENPNVYDTELRAAAMATGVECTLLKAIMLQESKGHIQQRMANQNSLPASSEKGARGVMQVTLIATKDAKCDYDKLGLGDAAYDILCGAKFMEWVGTRCCLSKAPSSCDCSNMKYRIAAYNGGATVNNRDEYCGGKMTSWECGEVIETAAYVPMVIKNYNLLLNNQWGC